VYSFAARSATVKMALPALRGSPVPAMRFLLMPIRSNKQGVQINVGKDGDEYNAIVNTMQAHPDDMKELGVAAGAKVRVRTEVGEAEFICVEAKVPRGLLFVPYGPPTCQLMGGDTDGTGMPTSKGWDVEVEPV
jgi:formylmethanofuran dehydrogenase subunit D